MIANEPDKIREVFGCCTIQNETMHGRIRDYRRRMHRLYERASRRLTFEDVERQRSDGDADHRLWMIEELDGFDVQREIIVSLQREE